METRLPTGLAPALILSGAALAIGCPGPAKAACDFPPPAGDDAYVCDSGISPGGLTDTGGNNSLTFPEGGSGTLAGSVLFGAGADTVRLDSGAVTGNIDLGAGADAFLASAGTVAGNLQQGAGIDDFRMTGGTIRSLSQGDNLDTFFMSDGRIVDGFDDGDAAIMTGGRIGRVNMKLDDNRFEMSGGTIDQNLVAGFGKDTVLLSGGVIGGNVSLSGGDDAMTVTGGTVGGEIRMSFGADTFTWDGGGVIYGAIDLAGDDDTATLRNLTNSHIGATPALSGGSGLDGLTLDNVKTGGVSRFQGWESIALANDSQLVFDGILTLGDAATGTGALSIDAASTIFGGGANGGIAAFAGGARASVTNAGRIDLTNGAGSSDRFTIAGDYVGDNGLLFLDTVLGDDASASDRLVLDGGNASGATGVAVVQAGGTGDATLANGIMLVEAANGSTTDSAAFALTGRVAAGAYEYFLFRGGVSAGTGDNWYLRSTLVTPPLPPQPAPAPDPLGPTPPPPLPEEPEIVAPPPPSEIPKAPLPSEGTSTVPPVDPGPVVLVTDPEPVAPPPPPPAAPADPPPPPPVLPTAPAPVPGAATPPTPGATPVAGAVVPLYRVEVPTFSAVAPAAHHVALATLGTFHERRGEQALLAGGGPLPASWVRLLAQHADLQWGGTVAPGIDGDLYGVQAGLDLFGRDAGDGHLDRVGLLLAYADFDGDVTGQALGWNGLAVGDLDANGTSLGAYWTHVGPAGWYVDAVLMGTWFGGDASAASGEGIDIGGSGVTVSLEAGYPFAAAGWTLEPQGQLVWNHLDLDDGGDSISSVSFDTDDVVTGRLGLRASPGAGRLRPYLKANLWHTFSADAAVRFGDDRIVTDLEGTALELGAGLVADLNDRVSFHAIVDYTTSLDDENGEIIEGNLGLSIRF